MTMTEDEFGDERLKKTPGESRASRTAADDSRTENNGSALTAAQRSRMLRENWAHEVLPNPPKIGGYHTCWLSTTNVADPIYKRVQFGYLPVRVGEIPGFLTTTGTGEFDGCVACNEMPLFKIPEEIYQEIMLVNHFERPNEEEDVLRANAKPQGQDNEGRELGYMEGFSPMSQRPASIPTFA